MSLVNRIEDDLKKAVKSVGGSRVTVLRMVKAELHNAAIAKKKKDLTDEEVQEVLTQEVKKRKEAAAQYNKGDRPERAKEEEEEAKLLATYLPKQLEEEELVSIVEQSINEIGASAPADMGKVMGVVMSKVKGKADGAQVKKIVQAKLTS